MAQTRSYEWVEGAKPFKCRVCGDLRPTEGGHKLHYRNAHETSTKGGTKNQKQRREQGGGAHVHQWVALSPRNQAHATALALGYVRLCTDCQEVE